MRTERLVFTVAALLVWTVVSWFLPGWVHVRPSETWLLRLALIFLGFAAAITFLWFYGRKSSPGFEVSSLAKEVDLAFGQAAQRLKSAKLADKGVNQFPLILLLGE